MRTCGVCASEVRVERGVRLAHGLARSKYRTNAELERDREPRRGVWRSHTGKPAQKRPRRAQIQISRCARRRDPTGASPLTSLRFYLSIHLSGARGSQGFTRRVSMSPCELPPGPRMTCAAVTPANTYARMVYPAPSPGSSLTSPAGSTRTSPGHDPHK